MKKFLKKRHVEYWLIERLDGCQERHVFATINDLLDVNIEGEKLKNILESIKIID